MIELAYTTHEYGPWQRLWVNATLAQAEAFYASKDRDRCAGRNRDEPLPPNRHRRCHVIGSSETILAVAVRLPTGRVFDAILNRFR